MYLPSSGGVERYTHNMALYLAELGYSVLIITSSYPGLSAKETIEVKEKPGFIPGSLNILRVQSFLPLHGRMPILKSSGKKNFTHFLDVFAPDGIIVQTRLYTLSIFAMKYAQINHIPLITLEHGSNYIINHNTLAPIEHLYERILLKKAASLCDNWYAVSKVSSNWLKTFGIKCKGILYNFINTENLITEFEENQSVCTSLNIYPDESVIIYCGRLIEEKGILNLLNAMPIAVSKLSSHNLHLIIIGEGPLESVIQCAESECIAKNLGYYIHLIGKCSHEHVISLFNHSDIFCFPTEYPEGLPTVLLEAAACGCFPISSDKGGVKEIISDSSYGVLLEDSSPKSIADALTLAVSNSKYRLSATKKVKNKILSEFDIKATADALLEAIEKATFLQRNR